jgi:DNA polymerase-3 subunit beta
LLAALQSAAAVVPARSPKPVLTSVKFEAVREEAVLSATDLEIGIRIVVEGVEVAAPGAVLLPSGRLAAIVRESAPGTVFDILSDGTATVVKAPRSEFRLPAEDPLEFPADGREVAVDQVVAAGHEREVGRKRGQWFDVIVMQRLFIEPR